MRLPIRILIAALAVLACRGAVQAADETPQGRRANIVGSGPWGYSMTGISNDAGASILGVRLDPTTKEILAKVSGTITTTASGPTTVVGTSTDGIASNGLSRSRTDTFTATGTGTPVTITAASMDTWALQVNATNGPATSFTVALEGSLDGIDYSTILSTTSTEGVIWGATDFRRAVLYFRINVTALVLGGATNIVVTVVGKQ
jgi:threonine dehydrogenase-like Zn-dependent dehydrogenase